MNEFVIKITNNTPLDNPRWDPSHPQFVLATLRSMIGLAACVTLGGVWICPPAFAGLLSGTGLAIVLFASAIQAGRVFVHSHHYGRTMAWLLLSQFILWVGMALLLVVVKVHPIGFAVGVSILPVAVLMTLGWYVARGRRMSS